MKKIPAEERCAFGCGAEKSPGKRLCAAHLKSERDKLRVYRAARKARGICWRCSEPARPGGMLCEGHRQEVRESERVVREAKKAALEEGAG